MLVGGGSAGELEADSACAELPPDLEIHVAHSNRCSSRSRTRKKTRPESADALLLKRYEGWARFFLQCPSDLTACLDDRHCKLLAAKFLFNSLAPGQSRSSDITSNSLAAWRPRWIGRRNRVWLIPHQLVPAVPLQAACLSRVEGRDGTANKQS